MNIVTNSYMEIYRENTLYILHIEIYMYININGLIMWGILKAKRKQNQILKREKAK